jgi:hypothetical protein
MQRPRFDFLSFAEPPPHLAITSEKLCFFTSLPFSAPFASFASLRSASSSSVFHAVSTIGTRGARAQSSW